MALKFDIFRHTTSGTPNTETYADIPVYTRWISIKGIIGQTHEIKFAFKTGDIALGKYAGITNTVAFSTILSEDTMPSNVYFACTATSKTVEIVCGQ